MKILHVINSLSRSCGGPSRSVQGLVAGLNSAGIEAWLMTLQCGDKPWVAGVDFFINGEPFEKAVVQVNPQIVHIHGIWSLELHRCVSVCRRLKIPYIIAPRGMLEPWSLKYKWFKKRIARWLYQDNDLKNAAMLHATATSEAEQFRKLGFVNPVIVSPNGVNVPSKNLDVKNNTNSRRILFVGRMHPKKGVMELIEAWKSVKMLGWSCELVYTVSGDFEKEYERKVKAKVEEQEMKDWFIFTGALNDEEKWTAYARADLFVLPTYSENFGIVIAEALWAGVPVITTNGTPWQELEEHKCGWWIDIGVEPLVAALQEAMALSDDERHAMGLRGRMLVKEKYTWEAVVKSMVQGYEEVLHGRT